MSPNQPTKQDRQRTTWQPADALTQEEQVRKLYEFWSKGNSIFHVSINYSNKFSFSSGANADALCADTRNAYNNTCETKREIHTLLRHKDQAVDTVLQEIGRQAEASHDKVESLVEVLTKVLSIVQTVIPDAFQKVRL